jgi:hypothetical protein
MATKKATAKFGASVKVQRGYPGKIRSSKDQGYTPVGEREPDRTKFKKGGWIQGAIKKPGALRASLGVKKGEKIPKAKLEAAAKKGGKLGQRARLAITLGKMRKNK